MDWRSEASGSSDRSMLNLARGNAALPFASQRARQGRQALHRAPRRSASANGDSPERQDAIHTRLYRSRRCASLDTSYGALACTTIACCLTACLAHIRASACPQPCEWNDTPQRCAEIWGRAASKQTGRNLVATQRNATQRNTESRYRRPSMSLSTVERCGQHTDLLSQLACLRYELVRDAKIVASLPARSRAQRRPCLKRCGH